ncbi:SRPBCC domain-containing protein [Leptospira sp. 96542]|nr:SRPBCC domain-containing protein [Leptospira sp. 96542]
MLKVVDQILINTPIERVWEILTNPEFIKEWDDIPENYSGGPLKLNGVIEWEGHAKMVVTEYEELKTLKLNLYLPKVELDPSNYDVNYKYTLSTNGDTILHFEIGDFSPLPNPQDYYESTVEWLNTAKAKIKELAES